MSSIRQWLYGPLTRFGLIVAVLSLVADQASKFWVLEGLDLENRGRVVVTPSWTSP